MKIKKTRARLKAEWMLSRCNKRYKVLRGGRASGKSWLIAKALIELAIRYKLRILCTREFQISISDSVMMLLSDMIESCGYSQHFTILKTSIVCNKTGSEFFFYGLKNNPTKIKGLEGIDLCWIEEAENVSDHSHRKILNPTIRKPGSQIWISYNPANILDATHQIYVINPAPNVESVELNYIDNPWFPEVLREDMEFMKERDYELYLHVWEGKPVADTESAVIKPSWIEASVDASIKLSLPDPTGIRQIGLDVIDEGGDLNALIYRYGYKTLYAKEWKEGDTSQTTSRAFDFCLNNKVNLAVYDAIGVGAGVKAKSNELNENRIPQVNFQGYVAGGKVKNPNIEYMPDRLNKDYFENSKAQEWWSIADRFKHTYNAVVNGTDYDINQIIDLSSKILCIDKLKAELSRPKKKYSKNSKVMVESKQEMAKRGIPSTNLADALIMSYVEESQSSIAGVVQW